MTTSRTDRLSKLILAAATGVMLTSGAALAGREDTIDANREILRQRIEQGRYSGQLTRGEYRRLVAEEAKIDADFRGAMEDGRISRREFDALHDQQMAAYAHVHEDSTNAHVSWWRRWLYQTR